MKTKAPTLRQFQKQFPTEDACLDHLMRIRFGDRHDCAKCERNAHFYRVSTRKVYSCEYCGHQVSPMAGTPFERTRTPLRDWFYVMFLFSTSRKGVAATEVQRQLGVTYKTAWRMCHEIRKYMGHLDGNDPIGGSGSIVEVDETYIGGVSKGGKRGRGAPGKTVVLGMMERDGEVVTKVVPNVRSATLKPIINANVIPGGEVHSDELRSYNGLGLRGHRHMTVNHCAGEYVSATGATVNAMEGFWAALKRGINGTHIHVSSKHLSKYLAEFEFRHNMRHLPHLMLDRMMFSFAR
ncbi:MAG: IS1595 family transposase [Novosphingobium sp.]|nr:IS1595 family transposase [Novosphingobium sp.]